MESGAGADGRRFRGTGDASDEATSGLAPVTYLHPGRSRAGGGADRTEKEGQVEGGDAREPLARIESATRQAKDFSVAFGLADPDARDSNSPSIADGSRPGDHPAGTAIAKSRAPTADRAERRAQNVSVSALARRGMSRWELEKTLVSRELEPGIVDAELDRLEGVGLIDDAALAETLVRTQHDRKGLGRSALTAELRRRHIDQEHIEAALEQVDDDDELGKARELAERRARQLTSLAHDVAVRRLTGYLMRKGYSSSIVRTAVDEALTGGRGGGVQFR